MTAPASEPIDVAPDDGDTYGVTAELRSNDVTVAKMYKLSPIFGIIRTLFRVPLLSSKGWCQGTPRAMSRSIATSENGRDLDRE
jgi:hypothetical protein